MKHSRNIFDSFRFAFAGLGYVLRTQRNMRIHIIIAVAVIGLGLGFDLSLTQWATLILAIGFVLVGEMLNTVVEKLVDLVSPEFHPLAKVVKDVTAGVVLLTAIVSVVVGMLILGPPLCSRVGW
ncbi:MAG TPA: diacylglycerol kinase family protein [Chloroflexi bacterium]|mgnify:CR=1 FL=1|nr:diacylglycerol kinase family protein [Chloroflexota bacterium]